MSKNDFKDNAQVFRLLNDPATCRSTFSNIMRTYQQCLYWHIRKMVSVHDDANDILQNTFIKAWKNILKYRGDANILTWLYRIATNETIDFLNSSYSKHAGECVDFETNLSTHLNNDVSSKVRATTLPPYFFTKGKICSITSCFPFTEFIKALPL